VVIEAGTGRTVATADSNAPGGFGYGANSVTISIPGGNIAGVVKDTYFNVLGGVQVTARNAIGNVEGTAVTGADGSFVLQNLAVGIYNLTCSDPTHDTLVTYGVISFSQQTTTVALNMNPSVVGNVHGTISDAVGVIPGAQIFLGNGNGYNFIQTGSGLYGTWGLGEIPVGTWTVTVSAPGYVTQSKQVTITANGNALLDFIMSPA